VIDIGSRIVEVVGLTRDPDADWMNQMPRNLLDAEDAFLRGKRYLILDRDPAVHEGAPGAVERAWGWGIERG